jgi:hypothetical protein
MMTAMNFPSLEGLSLAHSEQGVSRWRFEASTPRWQPRITPVWKRIAGGCELGRDIVGLLIDAGFEFGTRETCYSEGLRPFAFLYKGVAAPHARRGEVYEPAS